jgi:hypothetical protein
MREKSQVAAGVNMVEHSHNPVLEAEPNMDSGRSLHRMWSVIHAGGAELLSTRRRPGSRAQG